MPKKNVTLKTGLTRDEIVELLNLYQIMDDILEDASEIFDIDLSKNNSLNLKFFFSFVHKS